MYPFVGVYMVSTGNPPLQDDKQSPQTLWLPPMSSIKLLKGIKVGRLSVDPHPPSRICKIHKEEKTNSDWQTNLQSSHQDRNSKHKPLEQHLNSQKLTLYDLTFEIIESFGLNIFEGYFQVIWLSLKKQNIFCDLKYPHGQKSIKPDHCLTGVVQN